MSKMDSGDMIAQVRQAIGSPPTDEISNADVLRRINQVYMRLGTQFPMPEIYESTTITTSSGTAEYQVGQNILAMLDASDSTSGATLRWITPNQYERYYAASTTTGTPQYIVQTFATANNYTYVHLYPTPNGTYTIRIAYKKVPTELVTSPADNYTDFSEAWDEIICTGAAASCALDLGDWQRAQALKAEYRDLISSIYPAQIKGTQQITRLKAPWGVSVG